jgi:hypothetical protein
MTNFEEKIILTLWSQLKPNLVTLLEQSFASAFEISKKSLKFEGGYCPDPILDVRPQITKLLASGRCSNKIHAFEFLFAEVF